MWKLLELINRNNYTFSTCMYDNSKGVLRPKIFTITSNFLFSSITFSIFPLKPLKGPSITLIFSPMMRLTMEP